ncbi:hypothetical protein GCM10022408_37460 [Hymenobacter fastidiosus]|uniref:Uncharacterized protein n=1 Tax=Hymenobacter fastidiosus TaxID=486264 RepID=A0ABP7T1S5_9BACT
MPRYKGETKYEREKYARRHFAFMAKKYGRTVSHTMHDQETQYFQRESNALSWHGETANSDGSTHWEQNLPTPYCGKRFAEIWLFLNLLQSWPMEIKGQLDSEFYGDACDREYVRGMLRTVDIQGYFTDGTAITYDGIALSVYQGPLSEEEALALSTQHGSNGVFWGASKNRIRAEFVQEWLEDKEEQEATGKAALYNEKWFFNEIGGDLEVVEGSVKNESDEELEFKGFSMSDANLIAARIGIVNSLDRATSVATIQKVLALVRVLRGKRLLLSGAEAADACFLKQYGIERTGKARPRVANGNAWDKTKAEVEEAMRFHGFK